MLKHLVISGLTILTLFMFTRNAYSYIYAELPLDPYYKYMHVSDMYVPDAPATGMLSGNTQAARAVYVTSQDIRTTNSRYVLYRNYVRPGDRKRLTETEVSYLPYITTPSVNGKTATLVAPHGYNYHQVKTTPVHPIRDFRTEFWENKYYRDEFHNQASYNKTYGAYNYWNSAGNNESAGTPFGSKD